MMCDEEETRIFELPPNEFQDLLQAFGVIESDSKRLASPHSCASGDLLLSLREVTQSAYECERAAAARREAWRKRGYFRGLLWVALVAGLTTISISECAEYVRMGWEKLAELLASCLSQG